jgi:outer membrane protein assembly factor BamA
MNSKTDAFDSIMLKNPYLLASMEDYFTPEMRYTYTYTSPAGLLHPIRWETTLAESGNLVSLAYVLKGSSWNEKDKKLFKNPYSQFLKIETDFTKTWTLNQKSSLVAHLNVGYIHPYGNSNWLPMVEMFYVGGANSIRAFSVRGVGPGAFPNLDNTSYGYIFQNGNAKFVTNLEYRRQLFGNLYGAVFLDAGNVWYTDATFGDDETFDKIFERGRFRLSSFLDDLALGTGAGIRYDLGFLVLRLDWGLALHVPYNTEKSGYFNIDGFKGNHTLHFAIGYPF